MTVETTAWDIQDHLNTPAAIAAYLEAVFEDGDPALMRVALGDVARAKGMTQLSRSTGLSRDALYKALAEDGNPTMETLMAVLKALNLRLSVAA